ncbi:MAG: hypothetical protein ACOVNR_07165, partial [Chitinophagaceae bacterium]
MKIPIAFFILIFVFTSSNAQISKQANEKKTVPDFHYLPPNNPHFFPAGVCNTYTLTEKEGYSGFNYGLMVRDSLGYTYTIDNNNLLCCHGNNFAVCTDTLVKLGGSLLHMYLIDKETVQAFTSNFFVQMRGAKIIKTVKLPFTAIGTYLMKAQQNVFLICGEVNGKRKWYYLINAKLVAIESFYNNQSINTQLNKSLSNFVQIEDGNFCLSVSYPGRTVIFQLQSNLQLQAVDTLLSPKPIIALQLTNKNTGIFMETDIVNNNRVYHRYVNGKWVGKLNYELNNLSATDKKTIIFNPIINIKRLLVRQK